MGNCTELYCTGPTYGHLYWTVPYRSDLWSTILNCTVQVRPMVNYTELYCTGPTYGQLYWTVHVQVRPMGNCTELYCTGPTYGQQSNFYVQIREGKPSLSSNILDSILDSKDNHSKIPQVVVFPKCYLPFCAFNKIPESGEFCSDFENFW